MLPSLLSLRNPDGGWPYYAGKTSRLEPTCWALLALQAAGEPVTLDVLAGWPRRDGWFVDRSSDEVNIAFNGLAAVTLAAFGAPGAMSQPLLSALLALKGEPFSPSTINRQDNSLQGWPWTKGTFSWVEPTAWALLGVKRLTSDRTNPKVSARVIEAERLLEDRVCSTGGWNHGNSNMLGVELSAYQSTSAIGLMALQDRADRPHVASSLELVRARRLDERSGAALSLTAMALALHGQPEPDLPRAIDEEWRRSRFLENAHTMALATCALAGAASGYGAFRI